MVSTYSPHRDAGGTLHLHSPTSIHHIDAGSAIRELRRSLSRSPSKLADYRNYSSRSHSPSATNMPFSPSPLSPSRRSTSDNTLHIPSPSMTPSHAIPYPPSARASRPSLRRSVQSQNISRSTRTSPKSPSKRPLGDLSDGGNAPPKPLRKRSSTDAQCDYTSDRISPVIDKENEDGMDFIGAPKTTATKAEKSVMGNFSSKSRAASPMKRNEGALSVERSGFASPSAKRRSLHGPSADFNIFEFEPQGGELERRSLDDIDWSARYALPPSSSYFNTIPKRSSSLRKSTLQQRQPERLSNSKGSSSLQSAAATPGIANPKKGQRSSLDNHVPPMQRESPFSSQGSLLNASIHPLGQGQGQGQNQGCQAPHPPHPLSRTMTQSSSTSSMVDDSPTHEPIHRPDRPKSMFDFSKSLPIGSSRPIDSADEDSQGSLQGSFATPAHYKSAKPLPAAFMSTGLISKKNRNADDPHAGLPKAQMPDTPCKKQVLPFPIASEVEPSGAPEIVKPTRHSFGTPSTPFSSHHSVVKPAPFTFAKGVGVFGANGGKKPLAKRASFASIDGEEHSQSQSPTTRDSQTLTDSEYPPTPTKRVLDEQKGLSHASNSRSGEIFRLSSSFSAKPAKTSGVASSKLSPIRASPGSVDGDSDSVMEDSPSASLRLKSTLTAISVPSSSFTRGRLLRDLNSPTPLSQKALTIPLFGPSPRSGRTKLDCVSPVSPYHETVQRSSPHTPREHLFPPDPSGLSISGHSDRSLFHRGTSNSSGLPATPTGPRDHFPSFSNRQSLNLNAGDAVDLDQCLVSKFERVEMVGAGEFSQVYKVAAPPNSSPYHSVFSLSATRSSSRSSLPERVFAVKKSRYAYLGAKDRQRKIREVDVLKGLGHSDHVLSFVDSWEDQGHLYIQTEFCEEGTLDVFLAQVGLKARLDDFRIWKILLELSLVCLPRASSCSSLT
jgi:mitosis inhibitor protein kinase SWE1